MKGKERIQGIMIGVVGVVTALASAYYAFAMYVHYAFTNQILLWPF